MIKKLLAFIWISTGILMIGYNILKLKQAKTNNSNIPKNIIILQNQLKKISFFQVQRQAQIKEREKLFSIVFGYPQDISNKKYSSFKNNKNIILPSISGILKSIDVNGRVNKIVLIKDKILSEGQIINGFLIKKITDKGVYICKNHKTWFIPLTEVSFSIVKE